MSDVQRENVPASSNRAEPTHVTPDQLSEWLAKCQKVVDDHHAQNFPNIVRTVLSVEPGQKYARIVSSQDGQNRSAWAFVDLTNGDVLKSDGWKRPAKHARGNLYDASGGTASVGPYGPAYLK